MAIIPPRAAPVAAKSPSAAPLPSQMVGSFQNQQLGTLLSGNPSSAEVSTVQSPEFAALQNKLSKTSVGLKSRQTGVVDGAKRLTQIARQAQQNRAVKAPKQPTQQGMVKAGSGGYVSAGRPKGTGQIDVSQTVKIGNAYLRADAGGAFQQMNAALKAATGKTIGITEGWRSYDKQVQLYNLYKSGKGNLAAKPGTSKHGGGVAVDINNYGPTSGAVFQWLLQNSAKYGYSWDNGRSYGEPWHWEYVK